MLPIFASDVFGVVDLYGQSAQVSLCDSGPATSTESHSIEAAGSSVTESFEAFVSSLSESSSETSIATSGPIESDDSDIAGEAETEEELLRHATYNPLLTTPNSTSSTSIAQEVQPAHSESTSVTTKPHDTGTSLSVCLFGLQKHHIWAELGF